MQRLSRMIGLGYLALCLVVLAASFVLGPLGYAPLPLVAAPARPPLVLNVWYGSEKQAWLEAAVARFHATNPLANGRPIEVRLKSLGAREMAERLLREDWRGDAPPVVLAPASAQWLDALNAPIVRAGPAAPRSLVLSPLVVVGWEQRARALWPNGPQRFWPDLQAALANPGGWQALGGNAGWGLVKLGHTSPATSGSGTQALILLAYSFFDKSRGLSTADLADPALEAWLRPIEAGVSSFSDSTGALIDDLVRSGPAKYDFAIVYENLALQSLEAARQRQGQQLLVFYPPATILSDHPFALADGAWVQADERAAAARLREFLTGREAQQLALQHGFRPADPSVSIATNDPANPFVRYAANGIQPAIADQVEAPAAEVLNALVQLWQSKFGR